MIHEPPNRKSPIDNIQCHHVTLSEKTYLRNKAI
jgi:hypothetical protein